MLWFENNEISIFSSQKSDGDLLFKTGYQKLNQKVKQNRLKFFKKHKIDHSRLVNLAAVHGINIATFTRKSMLGSGALDPATRIPNTDGLITNIPNSYLMITGADCFPVLFYDEKNKVIGAIHAGWRGIFKEIIKETILKLRNSFDSDPSDINVWIGPGIKSCHFEVKKDVVELFRQQYNRSIIPKINLTRLSLVRLKTRYYIDLPAIIKSQLIESGVSLVKITEHPDCTFCEKDKYFSYRRDKPKVIHSNAYIIHLK